jgi:hypothetical protein
MTLINIIDARPGTPISTYGLEKLLTDHNPQAAKLLELESKLAGIEAQLKDLQKIATAVDKIHQLETQLMDLRKIAAIADKVYQLEAQLADLQKIAAVVDTIRQLEAQLKAVQDMVAALYEKVNSTPQTPQPTNNTNGDMPRHATHNNNGAVVVEQKTAPPTDVKEMLKRLMPTEEEIERMVLRVLYRRVSNWHGRADLKVNENGYAVIGVGTNFGVKYSRFVAIMAKYGLSDYVFARGNDNDGYYVEIKASEIDTVLRHLKALDETMKGALTRVK